MIEKSLVEDAQACSDAAGTRALAALTARLAEADPELPAITLHVYRMPIINAFAMPGDRIVMTGSLIERADRPEQVAGVLAHELGHSVHRHSEAQLIRATGMQILLSLLTGGSSDTVASAAGLAAILSYSREAEADADAFAQVILERAAIDPMALAEFFRIILEQEGKTPGGAFGTFGAMFSTHPGTEERISRLRPLPPDVTARPALSAADWQALRGICR
jgi:predicted Zn-dependent protease